MYRLTARGPTAVDQTARGPGVQVTVNAEDVRQAEDVLVGRVRRTAKVLQVARDLPAFLPRAGDVGFEGRDGSAIGASRRSRSNTG